LKDAVEDIGIKYYALPQRLEVVNQEDLRELHLSERGDQDTLGPNSPLKDYSPDDVARLYKRKTINRPQGE